MILGLFFFASIVLSVFRAVNVTKRLFFLWLVFLCYFYIVKSNDLRYNKYSLKFNSSEVEAEFKADMLSKLEYSSRLSFFVGGLTYFAFLFLDIYNAEGLFKELLINRSVVLFLSMGALAFSFSSSFNKYYKIVVVLSFSIVGLCALHSMVDSHYLGSIYPVVLFYNLIPFFLFIEVVIIDVIFLFLFILSLKLILGLDGLDVMKHTAVFFAVILISTLVFYVKQSLERRNFIKDKKSKETNKIISRQLKELELTHKNITDSINYAKRIQDALLPSELRMKILPVDLEIFYRPKDTIGGDFYWVEDLGETIVIAIGDCTGHGVPGALMTSLGINGLINSVTEQRMTDPSEILTYLDDYIFELLSETEESRVKDGMEIGIICINKKEGILSFSSAGRPLIFVDNNEIHRIKAVKRDIGSKLIKKPYKTENLSISSTATYYLFSDGMVDQFGGERNKRLGSKRFNELLLNLEELPILSQKEEIGKYYKQYMGATNQTDDMVWCALQIKK